MALSSTLLGRLTLIAVTALTFSAHVATAQVLIEGEMSYSSKRYGRGPWETRAAIESITNYDYTEHYGVRALLTFTPKLYVPGRTLKGATVASASIGTLESRTRLNKITLSGSKRIPRGQYHAYVLVINGDNQILASQKMPKRLSIRKMVARSSNLAHHVLLDSH